MFISAPLNVIVALNFSVVTWSAAMAIYGIGSKAVVPDRLRHHAHRWRTPLSSASGQGCRQFSSRCCLKSRRFRIGAHAVITTIVSGGFKAVLWGLAVAGFAGLVLAGMIGVRTFDARMLAALALFVAFGIFCSWLGHFTPRQLGTFWPIYFMLAYTIAGLRAGYAFVAIGLSITALSLIGYFFAGPWFELWMAFVDGGGLILGGLWMRRS
jgi:hypothetical protein